MKTTEDCGWQAGKKEVLRDLPSHLSFPSPSLRKKRVNIKEARLDTFPGSCGKEKDEEEVNAIPSYSSIRGQRFLKMVNNCDLSRDRN